MADCIQNYYYLKDLLTQKYGKPSEVIEIFQSDFEPRDDNERWHYLRTDRCKYVTIFETEKGDIQLSISHKEFNEGFVSLAYFDKINGDIVRADALDDL